MQKMDVTCAVRGMIFACTHELPIGPLGHVVRGCSNHHLVGRSIIASLSAWVRKAGHSFVAADFNFFVKVSKREF